MLRGVILDIDGTLVLSNDAHAHAWVQALAEHGYDVPFARVRPLIGMGGDKLVPAAVPALSGKEDEVHAISDRRKAIFLARYVDHLQPARGGRPVVLHMRQAGLRLVVASSSKPDEVARLLAVAHLDDLLQEITTPDDIADSKPAPDAVAAALAKLELPASEAIMIGDTAYDIQSARQSGVGTIALRCGGSDEARLAGAVAVYDDPADLLAHYEASPLGAASRGQGASH